VRVAKSGAHRFHRVPVLSLPGRLRGNDKETLGFTGGQPRNGKSVLPVMRRIWGVNAVLRTQAATKHVFSYLTKSRRVACRSQNSTRRRARCALTRFGVLREGLSRFSGKGGPRLEPRGRASGSSPANVTHRVRAQQGRSFGPPLCAVLGEPREALESASGWLGY